MREDHERHSVAGRKRLKELLERAERVHPEAQETHRLTEMARRQVERGRELSEAGREEAREVIDSVKWSVNTAGNGKRRAAGKNDD